MSLANLPGVTLSDRPTMKIAPVRPAKPSNAPEPEPRAGLRARLWLGCIAGGAAGVHVDDLAVATDGTRVAVAWTQADATAYAENLQKDTSGRFTGDGALIHPGWIAARSPSWRRNDRSI